jgi:O-antigen/teichoic acid export membrane protein
MSAATTNKDVSARHELKRTARGGFAFTVGLFASNLFQFGFIVMTTHLLTQGSAGALFEAIEIFAICNFTLGADVGLLRFAPIFRSRRSQDLRRLQIVAFGPAMLLSLLVATLVFTYAPQLVNVFIHGSTIHSGAVTSLRILAVFLPTGTLVQIACASLRAWSARAVVTIQSFIQPIGRTLLIGGVAVVGVTLRLATFAYVVPVAASCLLGVGLLLNRINATAVDPDQPPASLRSIASEFWRFSGFAFFGIVFVGLIASLDTLLVGAFRTARLAAAYAVASRYVGLGTFALQAIISSVAPQISRLQDAGRRSAAHDVYKSATWWSITASWPPLLVLAVFAPVFQRLFGSGYVLGSTALSILACSMLVNTGTGPNGITLQMSGKSGQTLFMLTVGLLLNVGLNIWLIPTMGLVGAAIAWTATLVSNAVIANGFLWRQFRFTPFGPGYAYAAAASLGCFGVLGLATRLVFGASLMSLVAFGLVSSSIYVVVVYRGRHILRLDAFESIYAVVFRIGRRLLPARVDDAISRWRGIGAHSRTR